MSNRPSIEAFLNSMPSLKQGPQGHAKLRNAFLELADKLEIDLFVEVGANEAELSIALRRLNKVLPIVAFEANPEIHKAYSQAMSNFSIQWENMAISDHAGTQTLFVPTQLERSFVNGQFIEGSVSEPWNTGKSSLRKRNEEASYKSFDIPTTTLDLFFYPSLNNISSCFLWIDAEGCADAVLKGSPLVLARTAALVVELESIEFWDAQGLCVEIFRDLDSAGFIPLLRDREYGDAQFNVLFVKSNLLERSRDILRKSGCTPPPAFNLASRDNRASFSTLSTYLQSEIPVFVPTFNNRYYAAMMIKQLQEVGFDKIVIVDNASTDPEMARFLNEIASSGVKVVKQSFNLGPSNIFNDQLQRSLLPRKFCLTDPDIKFNPDLPVDFLGTLAALADRFKVGKAGFALDISDRHKMRTEKFINGGNIYSHIWEWEEKFWIEPLGDLPGGDRVYKADIDTTFAFYNLDYFDPANQYAGLRVAGRLTAKHLPWYKDLDLPSEELDLYRATQKFSTYF